MERSPKMNPNDKNNVINKNNPTPNTTTTQLDKPKKNICQMIEEYRGAYKLALGKNLDVDRFIRIAITLMTNNPRLAECTPKSVLGALMSSAQLGLEPGILGQAFLVPRKKKGVLHASLQIGYKGLVKLYYNSPNAGDIAYATVYKNDYFYYELGTNSHLKHIPTEGEKGDIRCFYAVGRLKSGGSNFVVMTPAEINKVRDNSDSYKDFVQNPDKYKDPNDVAWVGSYKAMALKTCIIAVMNLLPLSTEKQISLDNTIKNYDGKPDGEVIDMTEVPDMTYSDYEDITPDPTPSDVPFNDMAS